MVSARCKLAYIRVGTIAITRSEATRLISLMTASIWLSSQMTEFKKMFPRTYRPTPTIVRAPRASKISADDNLRLQYSATNLPPHQDY